MATLSRRAVTNLPGGGLQVNVYTSLSKDKHQLTFAVGKTVTAYDVLSGMLQKLDVVDNEGMFALWIKSPLLELQLKPDHKIKSVYRRWDELLSKYTTAKPDVVVADKPVIYLLRNCFFMKGRERKLLDEKKLRLLWAEACFNVHHYRYKFEKDADYMHLAAIHLGIDLDGAQFHPGQHNLVTLGDRVNEFVTAHLLKRGPLEIIKRIDIRTKVAREWLLEFEQLCRRRRFTVAELYRRYLQFCWNLPMYGAVFFHGYIEQPVTPNPILQKLGLPVQHFFDRPDLPVKVGINPDGVHIIGEEKNELLFHLAHDLLSWDYREADGEGEDVFASLFLEFDTSLEGGPVKHLIEIFSRQATLMDAMITQCCEMLEEEEERLQKQRQASGGPLEVKHPNQRLGLQQTCADMERYAKVGCVQTTLPNGTIINGLPPANVANRGNRGPSQSIGMSTRV